MAETSSLIDNTEGFLAKIASPSFREILWAAGFKKELKKLEMIFSNIHALALDADTRQAENPTPRDWLEKLKDAIYDAEDALDVISTEAFRQKVEIHGSWIKKVSNFFSFSNPLVFHLKIDCKIKKIMARLDSTGVDRRESHLRYEDVDARVGIRAREQTPSLLEEPEVIGRNNDAESIVELLLSSDENLDVIPIVGLGGLGKTTLARLVFQDYRVVTYFQLRMWVCVSDDFDLIRILKSILESATCADSVGALTVDQLQTRLRQTLSAKKFLLVLDDVWNEDRRKWEALRDLLLDGASGCKIIVTTRNLTVASIMGTIPPYMLGPLTDDEGLSLLMRYACMEGHENEHPNLREIGKAIVAQCRGSPLAVKALGGLLYMKREESEWSSIRDKIWNLERDNGLEQDNGVLPVLKLIYQFLPSYLKPCFVYCSIFPKDYEIGRVSLINHWMAQGFLESPNTDRPQSESLEDIGDRYLNELMSRGFFQDASKMFDSEIYKLRMHDLLHDLAQEVAGTECVEVEFSTTSISERARHVMCTEYDSLKKKFPTSLRKAKKLRSFCFSHQMGPIDKSFVETLILRFPCLRLLDLSDSQFEELPSFVGKLKHLRFIRLSWNYSLKVLPNSISKLRNLQSLYLFDCERLQDLPRDFGKLISLRHLYLTCQLKCMPKKGLQGLTSLQSLVLSRCSKLSSFSEGIPSLRRLHIDECPELTSLPGGMERLEKLEIANCRELKLFEGEGMPDLRNLRSLSIRELPKLVVLPQGLKESTANIQYLYIQNCGSLTTLPEWLKDLTLLLRLYIINCHSLMSLPKLSEALQELSIRGCPHLSTRCKRETGDDWDNISHVLRISLDSAMIKRE